MFRKIKDFLEESEMKSFMGCRASRILCKQKTLSMSHEAPRRHDRAGGEGGPGPVQLPRPPRPAPRPPPPPLESARTWGGGGAGGQRAAELTPLGIKNLNSFLYFFRVEESRGRKYFTGRRFFLKKKKRICTWTVGKREREWRMGWEI